jgi:hypothetical protein
MSHDFQLLLNRDRQGSGRCRVTERIRQKSEHAALFVFVVVSISDKIHEPIQAFF